jgi:hypothetical protein
MMKASPMSCPPGEVNDDTEDRGDVLYGCFSPRVEDSLSSLSTLPSVSSIVEDEPIDAVVPPVLQIIPELQDLCVSPTLPLSVENTKMDSSTTLSSPERPVVTSSPIPPPSAHNPDALLAKELCDLLSGLDTAIPGLGRAVACLLMGTPIKDKIKKVGDCSWTGMRKEKSLMSKYKKSGARRKAHMAT